MVRRLSLTVLLAWSFVVAVPIAQLKTFAAIVTCCCPDPAHCHCPDHQPTHGKNAQLRACHKSSDLVTSEDAAALIAPSVGLLAPMPQRTAPTVFGTAVDYTAPPTKRRDLPS